MERNMEALAYVGPSFEELTTDEMLMTDGEATPLLSLITWSVVKVTASALVSSAVTFSIDRIFK